MQFRSIFMGLAASTAVQAAASSLELTSPTYAGISAGVPFEVSWTGADGDVSIILLDDTNPLDVKPIATLASGQSGTAYTWTPSSTLTNGNDYAIQIEDSATTNYGAQFQFVGGVTASATATASSSTAESTTTESSTTTASSTESSSATTSSTTVISTTSSVPTTLSTATSASSTITSAATTSSTGTATSSLFSNSTTTGASSTSSADSSSTSAAVPETTAPSSAHAITTPLALIFLTVAALVCLN